MSSLSWPWSSSSSSSASSATIDTHKKETQTRTTTTSSSNPERGKWNSRKAALFSALVLLNLTTLVPEQTKGKLFQVQAQVRLTCPWLGLAPFDEPPNVEPNKMGRRH